MLQLLFTYIKALWCNITILIPVGLKRYIKRSCMPKGVFSAIDWGQKFLQAVRAHHFRYCQKKVHDLQRPL